MARGIVFGVFDCFHEGHKHFLSDAAAKCDELAVVVARDDAVSLLKGFLPSEPLEARMNAIREWNPALSVLPGDADQGSWKILEQVKPDMALLGYDQGALAGELESRAIPYIYLSAHEPEKYKSSFFRMKPEGGEGS